MIYNDIYVLMNDILRAVESTDIDKKTRAFNEGAKQLVNRMIIRKKSPGVLLATTDLATVEGENKIAVPDDYAQFQSIWRKSGETYLQFLDGNQELLNLEALQKQIGSMFFDTNNQSDTPTRIAYDDGYIYTDNHFATTDTDLLKLMYFKYMSEIEAQDSFVIGTLSGDFTVGEIITGTDTDSTAVVVSNTATELIVESSSVVGTFFSGETITGSSSSETAVLGSSISKKIATLELGEKYKLALATSGSALYLYMEGSIEVAEKDAILEGLIDDLGDLGFSKKVSIRPRR